MRKTCAADVLGNAYNRSRAEHGNDKWLNWKCADKRWNAEGDAANLLKRDAGNLVCVNFARF